MQLLKCKHTIQAAVDDWNRIDDKRESMWRILISNNGASTRMCTCFVLNKGNWKKENVIKLVVVCPLFKFTLSISAIDWEGANGNTVSIKSMQLLLLFPGQYCLIKVSE